jgi:hypothetical protein
MTQHPGRFSEVNFQLITRSTLQCVPKQPNLERIRFKYFTDKISIRWTFMDGPTSFLAQATLVYAQ